MVILAGPITVEIGAAAENKEDMTNVTRVIWREVPQPSMHPVLVMNAISPISFRAGHRWIEGEIHCKSENHEAVHNNGSGPIDYLAANTAPVAIVHFLIKFLSTATAGWTATVTGGYIYSEELSKTYEGAHGTEGEEGVMIYKFVATSVELVADA